MGGVHSLLHSGARYWLTAAQIPLNVVSQWLGALPHPNRCPTKVVSSIEMVPKIREAATWTGHQQDGERGIDGDESVVATGSLPKRIRTGFLTNSLR